MSSFRKIIVWFLVCVVLAIYAKAAGFTPGQIGSGKSGVILGQQQTQ